jgi:lipooligosaccharide transport system permease protein
MNNTPQQRSFLRSIASVWYRHFRVYTSNFLSNGFPPFFEPLIFLAGIGLGFGKIIQEMDGVPYLQFLASGLFLSTAMMTSAYECTFGSFIRLEYEKIYDGILAAPVTLTEMVLGEILWAGTKGLFFSFAVVSVITLFGIFSTPKVLFIPLVGFLTGVIFACISLFITSLVKNIDNFSFYMTGFLSPMFFLSGVVFPLSNLPSWLRILAEVFPLTHTLRIGRAILFWKTQTLLWDSLYSIGIILIFGLLSIQGIKKRLVQ